MDIVGLLMAYSKIWCSYEWKEGIKNNEKYNLMAEYIRKAKRSIKMKELKVMLNQTY